MSDINKDSSLSRQLSELADNVSLLESIISQSEEIKAQLSIPEPNKPKPATRWTAMMGYVISGGILISMGLFFLLVAASANHGSDPGIQSVLFFLIPGAALIIVGVATSTKQMEKYNTNSMNRYNAEIQRRLDLQQQNNDLEKSIEEVINRIEDCLSNGKNKIVITEEYFYSDAIRFFADRIATGRSNSLAEAMDAYDEHLHRLRLEQAANQAAEYQRQSAEYQKQSADNLAALRRQGAVNTALHVANTIRHW